MTVVYPEGVPSLGASKLKALVEVADLEAPALATEINAVTSVEVTGYLFFDGYNPGGTQGKGQRRRRLGASSSKEGLNAAQWTSPTIQYTHDPNEIDSATGNEAREAFVEGTEWVFVERRGPDSDDRVRGRRPDPAAPPPDGQAVRDGRTRTRTASSTSCRRRST